MSLNFSSITPITWAVIITCMLTGIVLFFISNEKRHWNARMIANAALCISISFLLSYIRLYKLPQGGAITAGSMLPLFLFAYIYGLGPGMLAGTAYGFLEFIQSGYFVHPVELILDYPLAFAMLGLCAIGKRFPESWGMVPGIIIGTFGRFLCAFLSGIVFFGMYAPEGQSVFVYSLVYNGFYLIFEAAICIVLSLIPQIRKLFYHIALTETHQR